MDVQCPRCKTDEAIHTTASISYCTEIDGSKSILIEDAEEAQCSDDECNYIMPAEEVVRRILFELRD